MWLHATADGLIALAYFSIPFALWVFVRQRIDLQFKPIFVMFGLFILLCGMTHVMGIWTIWRPDYWADAAIKAATAMVSLATAAVLWPLLPKALALPSPRDLHRANAELQRANAELQRRVEELQA